MRRENKAEEMCEEINQGIFRIDTRHKSTDSRSRANRLHFKTNNPDPSVYCTKTSKNEDNEKNPQKQTERKVLCFKGIARD